MSDADKWMKSVFRRPTILGHLSEMHIWIRVIEYDLCTSVRLFFTSL